MQPPYVSNTNFFRVPEDITNSVNFTVQGWLFRSGSASQRASLPDNEKIIGMVWSETDNAQGIYQWTSNGWALFTAPFKKSIVAQIAFDSTPSGTTIGTLSIPATNMGTRAVIDLVGTLGTAAADGQFSVDIVPNAGAHTQAPHYFVNVHTPDNVAYSRKSWIDIPANTPVVVTFKSNSSVAGYYYFSAEATIYPQLSVN